MNIRISGDPEPSDQLMDDTFAAALRRELVTQPSQAKARRSRRRDIFLGTGLGFLVAVACGGTAVATGIITLGGGTVTTELSEVQTGVFSGNGGIDLGEPPQGATGVAISFTCLSTGTFTFDDGAATTCSTPGEELLVTHVLGLEFLVDYRVTVSTTPGAQWTLAANYVRERTTEWNVNENGHTYGVANEFGTPDLIAVTAVEGSAGYVWHTDLDDATGASSNFRSPEEALAWQEERRGKTIEIPVYESDGTTEIGKFRIN